MLDWLHTPIRNKPKYYCILWKQKSATKLSASRQEVFIIGREPDYTNGKLYTGTQATDPDIIKSKIGKEPLTAEEIATYLTKYSRRNVTFTGKTIRRLLLKLCEISDGKLNISDFQAPMNNNKPMYVVQPEYHGFILTLVDSKFLLDNKNDCKLGTREELYRDLIINIETYASEKDLKIIKSNPAFMNAKLECFLSESINNQINILFRELMHSDEVLRYQLMTKVLDTLIELNRTIMKQDAHIQASKLVYGHKLNEAPDGKYKKGMLQADGLQHFIIQLLALKIHGENYEYLNENEELSYPALWTAAQMYDLKLSPESDAEKELKRISTAISDDEKYQSLLTKAKKIFNLDDPREFMMFKDIMGLSAAYYLMPTVDENDYKKTVKFIEQIISSDKWDILDKFCKGEWSNNTVRELNRINELRGLQP